MFNSHFKEKPLTIKEGGLLKNKSIPMVTGKGKEIFKEDDFLSLKNFKTAIEFKEMMENFKGESSKLVGKINFKTTTLPTTPISCKIVESSHDVIIKANGNKVIEEFPLLADKQGNGDEAVNKSKDDNNMKVVNSAWSKIQNIRVDKLDLGSFLYDDGNTVQLHAENESINAKKLDCSLVVKLFEDNLINEHGKEKANKDVEEGEILHDLFTDANEIAAIKIQEQMVGPEGLNKEIKTVENSSSGKKVKLLKELKSLGYGNIVKHNRKLESGRNKKGGGPSPLSNQ
ncbi:hypothetical protein MA16_Dca021002 [Dendrobium catenatum]|uniref:Uncharacterized protein n=1 Tax=Dendrobium catenatum TaxID=906689 RepID=A0A2I0W5S7_9ASPA|nr:hypothetical protein MA16_Dca021002 [Dendrobium catenatum]